MPAHGRLMKYQHKAGGETQEKTLGGLERAGAPASSSSSAMMYFYLSTGLHADSNTGRHAEP